MFNFSHAISQLRPKQGNDMKIPSLYSLSMARYAKQKTQDFNFVNSWEKVCLWNGMVGGHGGAKVRLWWRDVKVCYDSGILYKLKWFDRFTPFNPEMTMWYAISYIWSLIHTNNTSQKHLYRLKKHILSILNVCAFCIQWFDKQPFASTRFTKQIKKRLTFFGKTTWPIKPFF